jgi:hypothetical protein
MVCRHSSECEQGSSEIYSGGEAGVGLVVSGGDAAELFESLKEVIDRVPPFVANIGIPEWNALS